MLLKFFWVVIILRFIKLFICNLIVFWDNVLFFIRDIYEGGKIYEWNIFIFIKINCNLESMVY